jgi:hypothetical protein
VTPSDKPEFLRIMNGLASVFGGQITPEALDAAVAAVLSFDRATVGRIEDEPLVPQFFV